MEQLVSQALALATPGQLAIELQKRLTKNAEIKIKPQWIRVQHTMHCDRLLDANGVDEALTLNVAK